MPNTDLEQELKQEPQTKNFPPRTPFTLLAVLAVVFVGLLGFLIYYSFKPQPSQPIPTPPVISPPSQPKTLSFEGFVPFSSKQEFEDYLKQTSLDYFGESAFGSRMMGEGAMVEDVAFGAPLARVQEEVGFAEAAKSQALAFERVSETNVQVLGIDEPDIVKTDGKQIYFSREEVYYWRESVKSESVPPSISQAGIKVIKAFPPADLKTLNSIDKRGDLLLNDEVLVIFTNEAIFGYDISDPTKPSEKWQVAYEDRNYLVSARAYVDKIYIVTQKYLNRADPCPLRPLTSNGKTLEIACTSIYHPVNTVPVDVAYSAFVLEPKTGEVSQNISFVGTSGTSVVYMSTESLYVTYSYYADFTEFFYNFLKDKASDLFPSSVLERVKKLMDYDISATSKLSELLIILSEYQASLNKDEELKLANELENRRKEYFNEHKRELEKTGIVKIDLTDFKVKATGEVSGQPLNQFSLDEYQNHLRLATTIGNIFGMWSSQGESANDIYVLDSDLKVTGTIQDLGLTERIYSARFIQDKGYLVTFRQTDPFYVLDLANPQKPELKGELKIPGYSSYLHPIASERILGIGKEGSQVKISLFDVADPANPREAAKYTLDEYWSDILNTHHAFLADSKHEIFFLPGSRGGYVFSYASDQLKLEKAVADIQARRALYINDYLYIIGDNQISVLNEVDWEKVNELGL